MQTIERLSASPRHLSAAHGQNLRVDDRDGHRDRQGREERRFEAARGFHHHELRRAFAWVTLRHGRGHLILNARFGAIDDSEALAATLDRIVGVVECGLLGAAPA
jgi:hypothetical protein